MNWMAHVRSAFTDAPRIPDDDVIEELAQHAHAVYAAARADGLSHTEALRRVSDLVDRWRLDASTLRHRSTRRETAVPPPSFSSSRFAGIAQDVRYAARLLRRQPRYTLLAALTMAIGIGTTTVLFNATYGVLVKPLPWPDADGIVVLRETRGGVSPRFGAFSSATYAAWRQQPEAIEEIGAWAQGASTLEGAGDADRIRIRYATASLFRVLRARPLAGRLFADDDERADGAGVVVLSEALWRIRFGADASAIGQIVRLDRRPYHIIGVLPDALAYPDRQAQAWVPYRVESAPNSLAMFNAIARLRPGTTSAQASSEGTARGRAAPAAGFAVMAIFGGRGAVEVTVQPLADAMTAEVRRPLLILLLAVGLLLVTATGNVASLQLARAVMRGRELAIRAAVGATRGRVLRQLVAESLLLGLIGGTAGLGLAWMLHRTLPLVIPADFPRAASLHMNTGAVVIAVSLSLLSGCISAALPALRMRRLDFVPSLSEDGATAPGIGHHSPAGRARSLIIAGQVAIACVLLLGASLLGRSFMAVVGADRGYDTSGVLTARVVFPRSMYTAERGYEVIGRILERLNATPSIAQAGFTSESPLTPGGSTSAFTMRSPDGDSIDVQASPRVVSPRAFAALGIRIVKGRGFEESDTDASEPVVIVNRTFATRFLGDDPLGASLPMRVGYGGEGRATVVGIVDDVKYVGAADSTQPEMYYSYRQFNGQIAVPVVTLAVQTHGDSRAMAPLLEATIRDADRGLVPEAIGSMGDKLQATLARPRFYAALLAGFAAFALIVAGVGLFGVVSYNVTQRSRELAIHAAVGARPLDIVTLVVSQGLRVTVAGLAAGLVASFALAQTMPALLYGITPGDAVSYVLVSAILLLMALAACVAPARRALGCGVRL